MGMVCWGPQSLAPLNCLPAYTEYNFLLTLWLIRFLQGLVVELTKSQQLIDFSWTPNQHTRGCDRIGQWSSLCAIIFVGIQLSHRKRASGPRRCNPPYLCGESRSSRLRTCSIPERQLILLTYFLNILNIIAIISNMRYILTLSGPLLGWELRAQNIMPALRVHRVKQKYEKHSKASNRESSIICHWCGNTGDQSWLGCLVQ
jgi:hypothetical protein